MARSLKLTTFQAGSPRRRGEGLRLGTVRFLPRGVRKEDYARQDYFDVWLPALAPSRELIHWLRGDQADEGRWREFCKRYRREIEGHTESRQLLKLLATIAQKTPIAVGCYCEDESHCHRSVLVQLIREAADE